MFSVSVRTNELTGYICSVYKALDSSPIPSLHFSVHMHTKIYSISLPCASCNDRLQFGSKNCK
jgi:hypothetical protein